MRIKYKLKISNEAQSEIHDAVNWYKNKALYLDKEFKNCLENGFTTIQRNPKMFPSIRKEYRRALIKRFPYQIIFIITGENEDTVLVVAVFHAKRNPERWHNR